jgi:DNA-binding HxlR family transcriptional regulator
MMIMDTLDMIKGVLNRLGAVEILKLLSKEDMSFSQLKANTDLKHNTQLSRALRTLNQMAIVIHVHKKAGPTVVSFYRINKRGRDILELIEKIETSTITPAH